MTRVRLIALVFGVALIFAEGPVTAETVRDFTLPPRDMPGTSWLDLLRQIFPDIAVSTKAGAGATATKLTGLRSIGVASDDWVKCVDPIEIESLNFYVLRLLDQDRVIISISVADQCVVPMALFNGKGKLVDAVNLKGDQHVSVSDDYERPLGAAGPVGPPGALATVQNYHDNSEQSYENTTLLLVKPVGFSLIGDVFAFGSHSCRDMFTETVNIDPVLGTGPMLGIGATVTRRTQRFAADCVTKTGSGAIAIFTGYWSWNAAKSAYQPRTRQLDRLADWNEKHF